MVCFNNTETSNIVLLAGEMIYNTLQSFKGEYLILRTTVCPGKKMGRDKQNK